jgi:hypothetical protein
VRDPARNRFPHIDTFAQIIPANIHWRDRFAHLKLSTE